MQEQKEYKDITCEDCCFYGGDFEIGISDIPIQCRLNYAFKFNIIPCDAFTELPEISI